MALYISSRIVLPLVSFFACLTGTSLKSNAQIKQPIKTYSTGPGSFSNFTDSLRKNTRPAILPAAIKNQVNKPNGITATCNTSTFFMHLTAGAGKKTKLTETQTMTDGNYLLAGNVTLPNNEQEGLLCVMSNAGAVVSQKQVRINNRPTIIYNIKTMSNGQVVMAGIVHEATDKVFVALLNNDLSISWLKTVDVAGPVSTALNVTIDNKFFVATQVSSGVIYFMLDYSGSFVWTQQMNITGLDKLVGIGNNLISANCIVAGRDEVKLFTFDVASGNIVNSTSVGDGVLEIKAGKVTSFNGRFISTGITKTNTGQFLLSRQINYDAQSTETLHTYSVPETIDFGISNASDNAGDVMGFCFPTAGKLLFLRHIAYYQIAPEYAVTYSVPVGSTIVAVTRSLNDGGYLFALNTTTAGESILIKTDSIGILAGCSYQNIALNYTEEGSVANLPISSINSSTSQISQPANITENNSTLASTFDCNQPYCPVPPQEDTCLSSYFKTFRSNSYVDAFGSYHLMKGNKHLMVTGRYNHAVGDQNELTYGIKLFDERGIFIKGVNVYSNGVSASIFSKKVDDQHVMIIYYSQVDGIPAFTFTLMDDNLQVIWSKSIKTFLNYNFFGSGSTSYLTTDKEGNYYFFGSTLGIYENARVVAYKMDSNGNTLWLKYYEIDATILLTVNATTTNTSVIMILDGGNGGSVSLRLDKATGEMLNAFNYQNSGAGEVYARLVQFDGDRIFYGGNDGKAQLVTGIFDTTAKPIKLLSFSSQSSIIRAGTVKSGKLYVTYSYFNGAAWKDVLLKADTALNLEYANEFDVERFIYPSGMGVSEDGSIYIAGNWSHGGVNGAYYDPVLKKYDANGVLGTCSYDRTTPKTNNVDLQTKVIGFREVNMGSFTPVTVPLDFVSDTYGQQVAEILCSSTPNCNSITLTGSNKVCQLNQPFTYHARRNTGCTIKPSWFYDTAFALLQTINDSTTEIKFKKIGSTWIKLKLNAGCSSFEDSMLVQVQQSPASFSLGNDTAICKGSSIVLNAGNGFNSYRWQDGSSNPVFTVTQPGVYFVTVDNVCGDIYSDTVKVMLLNVPLLNIGNDTSICKGDTLHLNATAGFSQYTWKPATNVTGQGATVNIYTLQNMAVTTIATTVEGCKAYDTLAISIKTARPVLLGNDAAICAGDSLVLSAGAGYLQYNWSNGASSSAITVKQAGTYSVVATELNGCKAKDTLQVQLFALPKPSLGNDFDLCRGSQRQLDAGNFSRYLWQDGSTGRYYTATATGSYWVKVLDTRSCAASDTIQVKKILPLPVDFLKAQDSICLYEKITIGALRSFSSYLWSTGTTQPALTVDVPGLYTLTVKDADGCVGKDSILILQKDCFAGVFIPTAFTPNNDTRNDFFKATVYGSLLSYRLEIFNRYGELVFSTNDPQKGWDGKYKGIALPSSTFIWQCKYQFPGQLSRFSKGNVVLIR